MTPGASPVFSNANAIGIAAMLVSMAAFVANDTCMKLMGNALPAGELIALRSVTATVYLLAFGYIAGGLSLPPDAPWRLLSWRLVGEFFATILFISGLLALPIADATALTQLMPLAITAAAAIFMQEHVGWRRWMAMLAGLIGVMMITRPGTEAFSPAALLVLASVGFMVLRDLATRVITKAVPTLTIAVSSTAIGIFAGLALLPFETWVWPDLRVASLIALTSAFLCLAFAFTVVAMRHGDVGVVSQFRYAVILFAILSGWVFWKDWPDALQMAGIALLTAAGLYTLHRERVVRGI